VYEVNGYKLSASHSGRFASNKRIGGWIRATAPTSAGPVDDVLILTWGHSFQKVGRTHSILRRSIKIGKAGWLSRYSDWATGWPIGVRLPAEAGIGFGSSPPRSDRLWGPVSYPWMPGYLSPVTLPAGRWTNHSLPSSAAKNAWGYTSTPPFVFTA
jgi:hypothetical protein